MSDETAKACDDCGRVTPVLMVTDYGCRYCRNCFRPGVEAKAAKLKKAKAAKESAEMNYETGVA